MSVSLNSLNDNESLLLTRLSEFAPEISEDFKNKKLSELLNDPGIKITDNFRNFLEECCNTNLKDLVISDFYEDWTGLKIVSFVDSSGNVGFSYYGTDSLDNIFEALKDISDDFLTFLFGISPQLYNALMFFDKVKNRNGNNYLFGHSHGGAICTFLLLFRDADINSIHLFNPQGLGGLIGKFPINKNKYDVIITDEDGFLTSGGVDNLKNLQIIYGNVRVAKSKGESIGFLGKHVWDNVVINEDGNISSYFSLIEVDTWKLRDYGMRLEKVQQRVYDLQNKIQDYNNPFSSLDTTLLKLTNNLINQFMQFFSDLEKSFNNYSDDFNLGKYCSYLFWTSDELENIERTLSRDLANIN